MECDIIILTECWLSCVTNLPTMNGYDIYCSSNHHNQNDGIIIFVKKSIEHKIVEPTCMDANCLIIKKDKDTAIISVYRPHCFKNVDNFLNSLNTILTELSALRNIFIVGDININILDRNTNTSSYLELLSFHGLIPAYDTATRGRSCIDHIILKTTLPCLSLIVTAAITDHEPVLFCYKAKTNRLPNTRTAYKINFDNAIVDCKNTNFDEILPYQDPNLATTILVELLQKIIIANTIKLKIPRMKATLKPWITSGLLRCIRNRDRMHMRLKSEPNNQIVAITYKRYRNFCNSILRKCKNTYNKHELELAKNNSKKLWNSIKTITNSHKVKDTNRELLTLKTSPNESVNAINEFFANVGEALAKNIRPTSITSNDMLERLPNTSFVLLDTDYDEVEAIISNLKSGASTGWDNISSEFLKKIKMHIVPPLTKIFNSCLALGVFPDAFKRSILIPIYKNGKRDCVNNYRPISILPSLSKVLEKIINKRLTNYLEKNKLISDAQYGFRPNRSTDDAVHSFIDFIATKLDKKRKCLTIFLDLAKAFDTVSLPNLLLKLEKLGVRGRQLLLFESYLSGRMQRVRMGDILSNEQPVKFGVPQGSILGPTLFLCYINELCQLNLNNCKIISYADDTTLTFYGESWHDAFATAQQGFDNVCQWLASNSLTLNTNKTNYITFSFRNYNTNNADSLQPQIIAHNCNTIPDYICNCPHINKTNTVKYLGITIDRNLNFAEHITNVAMRVRKLIFVFKQLRHVADPKIMKAVYLALCQSVLTYCISSWGGAAKSHIIELERAQRLILKISLFKPRLYPTVELYNLAEVLSVRQLYILSAVLKQHKLIKFDPNRKEPTRRSSTQICQINRASTVASEKYFFFQGPRLYNLVNRILHIYNNTRMECKKNITQWLQTLNYHETETLLNRHRNT